MKKIFIPVSVILILFIALKISFPYYIYHLGMKNYEQGDMYQAFIQFRYMVRHRPKNEKYKEMMEKAGNLYIQEQYDQWADYNLSRYGTVDDSWANLDDVALKMQLTDLFAARIEGWVMSPSLFKSLSNGAKDKFMRYFSDNAANYNMLQRPDFSLFDK